MQAFENPDRASHVTELALTNLPDPGAFPVRVRGMSLRVWIDADACPKAAKDQVVKFALKRKFEVVLVAGQAQIKPAFSCVKLIVAPAGPDAADDYLVEQAVPGELVICSDVPLADRLIKKGVAALDPRGKEFDPQNMGERLAVRNLFTDLREQGQMGGGQGPYGERERQAFANALDRILTRLARDFPAI
jgi:uncharacterized protein YaiI (UPF0178 family)